MVSCFPSWSEFNVGAAPLRRQPPHDSKIFRRQMQNVKSRRDVAAMAGRCGLSGRRIVGLVPTEIAVL